VPKFIDEMSPSAVKGTTGTYFGLSIGFGIFIGPLVALPIPIKPDCVAGVCPELEAWKTSWYVTQYWHVLFSLPIITAADLASAADQLRLQLRDAHLSTRRGA